MNIFRFLKNKNKEYKKGLGVSKLPLDIYRGKQPIKSNDFKKIVNEYFLPEAQKLGFNGKDFLYSREKENYTEIINFWTYKTGGAIQVDLLIKIEYPLMYQINYLYEKNRQ